MVNLYKMNFIKSKIIKKLIKEIKKRQKSYSHTNFFYFNEPIKRGDSIIDRINDWSVYEYEEILPRKFSILSGDLLLEILKRILNEEYYIFKVVNDKKYKIKMKKDDTFKHIN
jgi:hypothetical protein